MHNNKIGIVSPPYSTMSAGIVVLHTLIHKLRSHGFDAYLIPQWMPPTVNPAFDTPLYSDKYTFADMARDWIVLYPEGLYGNPIKARRVVRYLLNRESAFGGTGMAALPSDFLITYSRLYHPTAQVLFYPVVDEELLLRAARISTSIPRPANAFYIGKGVDFGRPCPAIPQSLEITRGWPASKTHYYDVLEKVRTFYSYDWCSSTNLDAVLLGCQVKLIGYPGPAGEGDLFREDGEFFGIWERSPDDGAPQSTIGARECLLERLRNMQALYDVRMVEIFNEICRMEPVPVS